MRCRRSNIRSMSEAESQLRCLENTFPAMSGVAFAVARAEALAAGQSVMEAEGGVIYEIFPDGKRQVIKQIEPPTPVKRGRKILIK